MKNPKMKYDFNGATARGLLKNFTDEELLYELVMRNKPQRGPRAMTAPEMRVTLRVGKNNHADLCISKDDLLALHELSYADAGVGVEGVDA